MLGVRPGLLVGVPARDSIKVVALPLRALEVRGAGADEHFVRVVSDLTPGGVPLICRLVVGQDNDDLHAPAEAAVAADQEHEQRHEGDDGDPDEQNEVSQAIDCGSLVRAARAGLGEVEQGTPEEDEDCEEG